MYVCVCYSEWDRVCMFMYVECKCVSVVLSVCRFQCKLVSVAIGIWIQCGTFINLVSDSVSSYMLVCVCVYI